LRAALAALLLAAVLSMVVAAFPQVRAALLERLPPRLRIALVAWAHGVSVDHSVQVAARDGVRLATSVYLPRRVSGKLPTVLIRLPYHRLRYGEGYRNAVEFARQGYATVVQDLRGTGDSEGRLLPWRDVAEDGAATLDWITRQPWSNGKVGTFGCSALGETQYVLARLNHPAHRAMVPSGAGGAVGSLLGEYGYFGVFEGGVFQLASGFGWFADHGPSDSKTPPAREHKRAAHLRQLPVSKLVQMVRPGESGYAEFLATPLSSPQWADWGYWSDSDRAGVPALVFNTWGDQTVAGTFALAEAWRRQGVPQTVVIGPGNHCGHRASGATSRFGQLPAEGAAHPWDDWTLRWFDHWLKDIPQATAGWPAYRYFMLVENRWHSASRWPPAEAQLQRWYLSSGTAANGRGGDGVLILGGDAPPMVSLGGAADTFRYDPNDPVPSRGGPLCCTGNPVDAAGPADQADVESRHDVLVYTSEPLSQDMRIAGPLKAQLAFSSDAPDTDLVARLVHVRPDGLSTNIQEGALRLRYRDGIAEPQLLRKGEIVRATVDMRSIAYMVPRGHRLRLHVASSSFPRLERNLNTGAANNANETRIVIATNRVHHSATRPSWVELPVIPAPR
jgi:hypothetical protein